MPVRANLGLYTQPISFIGLPVVAVPVPLTPLPIAVQIIAAPWREDVALRIAHALETQGVAAAMRPPVLIASSAQPHLARRRKPWRSTCRRSSPKCKAAFERYEKALVR